jgi:hypothetical protein
MVSFASFTFPGATALIDEEKEQRMEDERSRRGGRGGEDMSEVTENERR